MVDLYNFHLKNPFQKADCSKSNPKGDQLKYVSVVQFEHRRLASWYLSRDKATIQVLQLPECYGQNDQKEKL